MSDVSFVQEGLRSVYTVERFGSVKAAQYEAYKMFRRSLSRPIPLRRVRAMFEGTLRVIRGEEKDAVRAARIEEARNEREQLRARLDRLDGLLAVVDAEFFGAPMASSGEFPGSSGRAGSSPSLRDAG
jgi:hypothetical protein